MDPTSAATPAASVSPPPAMNAAKRDPLISFTPPPANAVAGRRKVARLARFRTLSPDTSRRSKRRAIRCLAVSCCIVLIFTFSGGIVGYSLAPREFPPWKAALVALATAWGTLLCALGLGVFAVVLMVIIAGLAVVRVQAKGEEVLAEQGEAMGDINAAIAESEDTGLLEAGDAKDQIVQSSDAGFLVDVS